MQIHFSPPEHAGELPVHTNAGSGRPFAVIQLGGGLDIRCLSGEDCDRIVRAAVRAKAMLDKVGRPHQFVPMAGNGYRCDVCGDLNDGDHPKPDAALSRCAECGHLVCDCGADSGDDPTDSIAEGHDADVAAAVDGLTEAVVAAINELHAALVAEPDGLEDAAAQDAPEPVLCQRHGGEFGPADCDKCAAAVAPEPHDLLSPAAAMRMGSHS